jgi:hypothetical protein
MYTHCITQVSCELESYQDYENVFDMLVDTTFHYLCSHIQYLHETL